MARQFAKTELAPITKEIDEEGRFPWEVVEKMASQFFWHTGSQEVWRS